MKYAMLVAMREYAENARTKGFWIGLLMFPVILVISLSVPKLLDKATPTRHFIVVDQTGNYEQVIDDAIDRLHRQDIVVALSEYAKENRKQDESGTPIDLEKIPAIDTRKIIEQLASSNPQIVDMLSSDSGLKLALNQMKGALKDNPPEFEPPRPKFKRVHLPEKFDTNQDLDKLVKDLRPYLKGDEDMMIDKEPVQLFAAVLIPKDAANSIVKPGELNNLDPTGQKRQGVQYWAKNLADTKLRDQIKKVVNEEIRQQEYEKEGLDTDKISSIRRTYLPFNSLNPKKEEGEEMESLADQIRQWAPVGFVYLLWIGVFTISQMLLNNTIEEKSNRIIEVLLSSVTPQELMMGKLVGIAGIGLTMIATWIGSLIGILWLRAGPEAEFANQLFHVLQTSGLLPAFTVYFFLGYLIYSGIFLAIGSVCNTIKDAQNLMGPVMLVMIVPLMTMMFIPKDPHGTLATVLSWIPIYTPFVMMNRAAADPPLFDLIGTLILLVVTAIFVLWMSSKIFRIGILRSGQPPKFMELVRWLRRPAE